MPSRCAFVGLLVGALCAAPSAFAAPSVTTGDAYSNGSGGTASSVRAKFAAGGCTGAISYHIGPVPLAQGGYRTINSSANYPSRPPGSTSDVTSISGLSAGSFYYYRAVVTTYNCSSAGQTAFGAQRCLAKKGSINELESVACPGDPAGGGGGSGGGSKGKKCKRGSKSSCRIKLPGKYCRVKNGFSQTYMFALKVKGVKCKVAEALVDRNRGPSGDRKRFRLRPSKAICKAIRDTGTGVEYVCKYRRQKLWYFGYGQVNLKRQIWTNLYPRGS